MRRVQSGWQSEIQDIQCIRQKESPLEISRMPRQAIDKGKLPTVLIFSRKGADLSFHVVNLSGVLGIHTANVVEGNVGGIPLQRGEQARPGGTPGDLQMILRGLDLPERALDISRIPQRYH